MLELDEILKTPKLGVKDVVLASFVIFPWFFCFFFVKFYIFIIFLLAFGFWLYAMLRSIFMTYLNDCKPLKEINLLNFLFHK